MQKILSGSTPTLTRPETWSIPFFICAHLFPIFIDNFPTIQFKDLLKEILFRISINTIIAVIAYLFLRNRTKAVSITLVAIAFEFYFSITHSYIKSLIGPTFITSYSFILPIGVLLVVISCMRLIKTPTTNLPKIINYYSIAIVCYAVIANLFNSTSYNSESNSNKFQSVRNKPSIVLVILDEYAGKASLRSHFKFDNSDFLNKMKELNFDEVENPRSLYNSTIFSMASFFGMEKLNLSSLNGSDIQNRRAAIKRINENPFIDFLKSNEYNIHNHSIFPFNHISPPSDYFKLHVVGSDLLSYYNTSSTVFRDLSYHLYTHEILGFGLKKLQRKWVTAMNDFIDETASTISSTAETDNFHYVHFIMPHAPFVYKSDGTMRPAADFTNDTNETYYLEHLKYCNKLIIEWLKKATQNKKETIFIVMSDHGWKSMIGPSPDKIEFNTILFVRGLKKKLPEDVLVPNILPHLLESLCDTTIKKISAASIYMHD